MKVYVISIPLAIDFIVDDDINGFKELLASDDTLYFPEPAVFDSEEKDPAFCAGLGYGKVERTMPDRYPLRTCEPTDPPLHRSYRELLNPRRSGKYLSLRDI